MDGLLGSETNRMPVLIVGYSRIHAISASMVADGNTALTVALDPASDSGISNTDGLTNATAPTFNVTVNIDGVIAVDFDGDGIADVTQAVSGAGTYDFTPTTPLADGTHTVTASFTAGESPTVSASTVVTVDTTGPVLQPGVTTGANTVSFTLSNPNLVDPASITDAAHYQLLASGGDGTFGDVNEVDRTSAISNIAFDSETGQVTITLQGLPVENEWYRLVVTGLQDSSGAAMTVPASYDFNVLSTLADTAYWTGTSDGDWSDAANWYDNHVPTSTDDVFLPVAGVTTTIDGDVTVKSINGESSVTIDGGSFTVTGGASQINGALTVSPDSSLTATGTGTSLVANGATVVDGAYLYASGGATLSLPNVTSLSESNGYFAGYVEATGDGSVVDLPNLTSLVAPSDWLYVYAYSGGRVNLPSVATVTDSYVDLYAEGGDSVIDLSGMTELSGAGNLEVYAYGGGYINLPYLATVTDSYVNFSVDGGDSVIDLSSLTDVSGAGNLGVYAYSGGHINLSNLATVTDSYVYFEANGGDSVIELPGLTNLSGLSNWLHVRAYNGGQVDLFNLATVTDSYVNFYADGSGSVIDLSALASVSDTNGSYGYLSASNGGQVIDPQLTTVVGLNISLGNAGASDISQMNTSQLASVTNGSINVNQDADFSGLTSLVNSSLSVYGAFSFTLAGLTTLEGTGLYAYDGAFVTVPNVTTVGGYAIFQAQGTGSVLNLPGLADLSGLSNWLDVRTYSGGHVDLSNLATVTDSYVNFNADGSGSVIDLSALASVSDTNGTYGYLSASNGGQVIDPQLTTAVGLNITLGNVDASDISQMNTSQLASVTNSSITVYQTADFGGVTTIDGSSLYANNGAMLSLPNVTSYSQAAGGRNDQCYFQATGADSVVELPNLTSLVAPGNEMKVYAYSGGRINLPQVATVTDSYLIFYATDSGSVIDLPVLESFSDTNGSYGYLSATNGGQVNDPLLKTAVGLNITLGSAGASDISQMNTSQLVSVTNGSITVYQAADFGGMTTIDGSSLYANSGATLSLPNITSYSNNACRFQATDAGSVVDLPNLTSLMAPSNWLYVFALSGGRVNLSQVATVSNSYVYFDADGGDSVIDLSALTSFSGTNYGYLSTTNGAQVYLTNGTCEFSRGNIVLSSQGVIFVGTLELGEGAQLQGDGTLSGSLINGGQVLPNGWSSPGGLTIEGDYSQTAEGQLCIDIAGSMPGTQYDQLVVGGTAALDGTLAVNGMNGYIPDFGTSFAVITSNGLAGQFASYSGLNFDGDTELLPTFDATGVTLVEFSAGPVISNATANAHTNSATVSWTTDIPATSQVEYGLTDAYGQTVSLGDQMDTARSMTVTGLEPETTYHYRVISTDPAGNTTVSSDAVFTTQLQAVRDLPGFSTDILDRNDDGSTDFVPTGFTFNFFGTLYSGVYINNNGNITFTQGDGTYVPYNLTTTGIPIIAPFFADVDTRNPSSGVVHYGQDTIDGHAAFGVEWPGVGQYDQNSTPNTFELVLIDRSDTGLGNFDFELNYDSIQWDYPARAGYSAGPAPSPSMELPGSGTGRFLDSDPTYGLVNHSFQSALPGRYYFTVRNGDVVYQDLVVTGVTLTPSGLQSSQTATVSWNDVNAGNATIMGNWVDRVTVVNTTTGQTVYSGDIAYDQDAMGSLTAGSSVARSVSFAMPDGEAGVGDLLVTVTTDALDSVAEYNAEDTGEANNSAGTTGVSTLAPYPDLQVNGVAATEAVSGRPLTITWRDENRGETDIVNRLWRDQVVVENTTTGHTLLNTLVDRSGNIATGDGMDGTYTFRLPDGTEGAGTLQITVTTDVENAIFEYTPGGSAESNNVDRTTITSVVADVTPPTVVAVTPTGLLNSDISTFTVTFSEAILSSTFTASDVAVTLPNGELLGTSAINVTPTSSPSVFRVDISPALSSDGHYSVAIGPNITDLSGNPMSVVPVINDDFATDPTGTGGTWQAYGSAAWNSGGFLRLTPAAGWQAGAAYFGPQQAPAPFVVDFDFNLNNAGGLGNGADGFCFVVAQNAVLGGSGVGMGYSGALGTSFAVEFDTFNNGGVDPNNNHIALDWNGSFQNTAVSVNGPWMNNSGTHHATIRFDGTSLVTVTLVGPTGQVTSLSGEVPASAVPSLYTFGFTAATGAGWANHDIDNVRVQLLPSGGGSGAYETTFTIDKTPPVVAGTTISSAEIDVHYSDLGGMDAASVVDKSNYALITSGGDGVLGNGNDLVLTDRISDITYNAATGYATISFTAPLADEVYQLTINGHASVQDLAGNKLNGGTDVVQALTLNTTPASAGISLQTASDAGISQTDHLTNRTDPTFDVTVNKAGVIGLDFNGDGTYEVTRTVTGAGTFALTAPALTSGTYTVTANFTAAAGGSAASSTPLTVDTQAPTVVAGPANEQAPFNSRIVKFSSPVYGVDLSSAITLVGPNGSIPLTGITAVGSAGDTYQLTFATQIAPGQYTVTAHAAITDAAGNPIGSGQADTFTVLADVTPPAVISLTPTGLLSSSVSTFTVTFSEAILSSTFTGADVNVSGPGLAIDPSQITIVPVDGRTFTVNLPTRTLDGTYDVTIGPDIRDLAGNAMTDNTLSVYTQDFSAPVGSEWSYTGETTSNGERFLAPNANGMGAGTVQLTLNNLPAHTGVSITFDLYIIQSWDGNGPAGGGADGWQLAVNSVQRFISRFANYAGGGNTQAYPAQIAPLGSGGSYAPRTGAYQNGHLGLGTGDFGDSTYRLTVAFPDAASALNFAFTSLQNQSPGDEGWGLDNVNVSLTGVQAAGYHASFTIDKTPPRITAMTPSGNQGSPVDHEDITFNSPIDPASLNTSDVSLTGPAGNIAINSINLVSGNTYRINFASQSSNGAYTLAVTTGVHDFAGNALDQSNNGIGGEANDGFTGTFTFPVFWTDWTSGIAGSNGSATGVLSVNGSPVTVNYSGEIAFIQTNGGTNYWSPSSPYISATVPNAPGTTDIIALSQASQKTVTFSQPITDPLFAIVSLNGNGYRFNRDFRILSSGSGYFGNGTFTRVDLGNGLYEVDGSGEPHGVIQFLGTFNSISWTSLTNENWNGFTIGVTGIQTVPDIQASNASLVTPNPQSGQTLTVNWTDTNNGAASVVGWTDSILVTDSHGATVYSGTVPADALPPGASEQQTASFALPDGLAGTGVFTVRIIANSSASVGDFDPTNDAVSFNFISALAPYPDLSPTINNITPASPLSGQAITINWSDSNIGTADVSHSFVDHIVVINTTTGQTLLDTTSRYDTSVSGNIAANASVSRSIAFMLPTGSPGAGNLSVTITVDSANDLPEYNSLGNGKSNNIASLTATSRLVPSVSIALESASDSGPSSSDRMTNVSEPTFDVTVNQDGTIGLDVNGDGVADVTRTVTGGWNVRPCGPWVGGRHSFRDLHLHHCHWRFGPSRHRRSHRQACPSRGHAKYRWEFDYRPVCGRRCRC